MRRPNSFGQVPHEMLIDAVVRLRRLAREQDHKSPFVFAGRRSMPQHVWMRLEAEFGRFACTLCHPRKTCRRERALIGTGCCPDALRAGRERRF